MYIYFAGCDCKQNGMGGLQELLWGHSVNSIQYWEHGDLKSKFLFKTQHETRNIAAN